MLLFAKVMGLKNRILVKTVAFDFSFRNSFIFHHLKTMDEEVMHFNVAN